MNDSVNNKDKPESKNSEDSFLPIYDSGETEKTDFIEAPLSFRHITLRRHKNLVHKIASTSEIALNPPSDSIEPEFHVKIQYQVCRKGEVLKEKAVTLPLADPNIEIPDPLPIFENALNKSQLNNTIDDWTLSTPSDVSITMGDVPIEVIVSMIQEYSGDERDLNIYINKIDRLWKHIENNPAGEKARFMLTLQINLNDKAAHATKDVEFNDWAIVRQALKTNINPQKNIEKAELKLSAAKQTSQEDVETFAQRISELLDNLNKSFCLDNENDILKRENDRKARKAFENGLVNTDLRNRAIARGNKTFRESVDYVVEQELRQYETRRKTPNEKFCTYCSLPNHEAFECRKRRSQQNLNNRTSPPTNNNFRNPLVSTNFRRSVPTDLPTHNITCYFCNERGHYASQCSNRNNQNGANSQNNYSNTSNNMPNSPRRSFNPPNSPGNGRPSFAPRTSVDNRRSTNVHNTEARDQSPRNVRLYQHEVPLEEAIVLADDIIQKN